MKKDEVIEKNGHCLYYYPADIRKYTPGDFAVPTRILIASLGHKSNNSQIMFSINNLN